MSYFDDPKHKAAWDKELSALKKEKERRKAEGITGEATFDDKEISAQLDSAEKRGKQAAERYSELDDALSVGGEIRQRMTYAELVAEENMAHNTRKTSAPQKTMQKEASREL